MENCTTVAIPPSKYNDFLFTVIHEEPNGTQLSVLSALTRVDIDPWEEAARLSEMTDPIAKRRLISVLNQASENSWSPSEKAAIATRLIGRLPPTNDNGGSAPAQASEVNGRMLALLVCWWSFAITIAVFSSYQQRVQSPEGVSTAYSSSTTASKDVNADIRAKVATD